MKQMNINFVNIKNGLIKFIKENKFLVLFFLISFVVFLVWLVAFYPGIMTPDSNDQWAQAYAFAFSNHHPFFATLLIAILQRIWYNPAFIAILQIIGASFIASYFLNYLIKKGLNKIVAVVLFLAYIASPAIGIYNVTLWKDIPFSLGIFGLSVLFVIHYLDGFSKSRVKLVLFALLITVVASLRHNGVLFIIFIPFVYYILKVTNLKKTLIIFVISIGGYFFIQFLLFNIIHVQKANFITSVSFIHMVAGAIHDGYVPTADEKATIEKMISIDSIKANYDCRNGNSLYFNNPSWNGNALNDDNYKALFDQTTISIIRRNIPLVLANRACQFGNMIGFDPIVFYVGDPGIGSDMIQRFNLPTYQANDVSNLMIRYENFTFRHQIPMLIFWNVLPYITITIGVFIIRRNKLSAGYLMISLFNLIPLFIGGVGGDFRFVYSIEMTGIFAVALLLLPRKQNKEEVLTWNE